MPVAALLLGLGLAAPGAAAARVAHHAHPGARSADQAARASSVALPSVSGGFGTKPTITFPSSAPPKTLVAKVLHQGDGPVVKKANLLVCNYYAQIWRGKVFDSSFGQGLFSTPIGVGAVVPGWDKALVGARVGSRMLLVLPPADGYGASGNSQAGISGTDTIVFVVDVVAAYNDTVHGDPHATVVKQEVNGIKVGGPLGGKPTVEVTKGAPKPSQPSVTLIARGHGAKIKDGLVVDQYVVGTWSGTTPTSTWSAGTPDGETVGGEGNVLDSIVGMPLGSRVLVEIPKSSNGGPFALVVDLVAEPKNPK